MLETKSATSSKMQLEKIKKNMNHIHYKMWDEITCPFQTSIIQLLKFGNG